MKTNTLHSRIYAQDTPSSQSPLLILHGLLGLSDNWASMARRYASQGIRTHTIDLPYHGRSPHTGEISQEGFAQTVAEYMDACHMEKAYILGHSLGGKAAMSLACMYPEKVEKLMVADISPAAYPAKSHEKIFSALEKCCSSVITSREDAHARLAECGLGETDAAFLLKSLYRTPCGEYTFRFDFKNLAGNMERLSCSLDGTGIYTGETLFIKGGMSSYITDEHIPLMKKMFPHHTLHCIPHAGHWVHADAPQDFYDTTFSFLSDNLNI